MSNRMRELMEAISLGDDSHLNAESALNVAVGDVNDILNKFPEDDRKKAARQAIEEIESAQGLDPWDRVQY